MSVWWSVGCAKLWKKESPSVPEVFVVRVLAWLFLSARVSPPFCYCSFLVGSSLQQVRGKVCVVCTMKKKSVCGGGGLGWDALGGSGNEGGRRRGLVIAFSNF